MFVLVTLNVCKRKRGCTKNTYGGINEVYFLGFRLLLYSYPNISNLISTYGNFIRPDVFFPFIAIAFMRINLIRLPKQSFIVEP